jgi:hypothetical protein
MALIKSGFLKKKRKKLGAKKRAGGYICGKGL